MPLHVQPVIRFLEEVKESEGVIVSMDSVGVTQYKAAENAGTKPKIVPLLTYFAGKGKYTAS